jgi:hypothetical protein
MGQTDDTKFFEMWNRTAWVALKAAAQSFTATWTDVGTIFNTKGASVVTVCFDLAIGDTVDPQFRVTSERSATGTNDYKNGIYSPEPSKVVVQPCVIEIGVDSTDKYVLQFPINKALDFATLQIYAAVPGASAATVTNTYYRLG